MIHNFPVTISDSHNTHTVYGPDVGYLCCKTVLSKNEPVVSDYIAVPPDIIEQNRNIDVTGDILFVNRISFLINLGQKVKFATVKIIVDQKAKTLMRGLGNTDIYIMNDVYL